MSKAHRPAPPPPDLWVAPEPPRPRLRLLPKPNRPRRPAPSELEQLAAIARELKRPEL